MAMGWDIAAWIVDQLSNRMHGKQEYTAAGTYAWTKPAGVKMVHIKMIGGGGGGGGGNSASADGGGTGGGSGYFIEADIDVSGVSSVQCTVGAGGAAGGNNQGDMGGAGGVTSFGSFISVNGGGGGTCGSSSYGLGTTPGGGRGSHLTVDNAAELVKRLSPPSKFYNGRWGFDDLRLTVTSANASMYGGMGGPGIFGRGGRAEDNPNNREYHPSIPGEDGSGGGGGGGGRAGVNSMTGVASRGGSGRIIITW